MQITRQAEYATRAILYLAQVGKDQRVATHQVARAQKIPPSFLAKIISQLSIAGLLNTSRGAHGGISLAREPEQITVLEVVEAIDGRIQLNACIEHSGILEENYPLQLVWQDAQNKLVTTLKDTNFAQLVVKDSAI
ncbi:MAG: Rrf2 family transcriptional regulator [Anaerolineae bacterium]|nr:Rrf2 family transcriptional regulator [Anaerolineae bacterium]MCI0611199.1 Rrf2 family transcriptional regulator [Anaerolineae bacterium]